ncbi:hypothetical protein ADK70_17790 [Streptomyces rimosus subsp. pseudoverticillatus]|uniref:universal stress protein n=1 Tax=Streptomyces rimosus TaxID=1927 RepID=UPI0006B27CDA|nr:universal stress protein [Streptomyces rimosus]KOT90128.1 hypothetical protein ADK70_17790 [Streptomyces rimosus subsp. pseudoverticillatus]
MVERPVIVGVDGSDSSLAALDWAAQEARLRGLPLRIVFASLWERYEKTLPSWTVERSAGTVEEQRVLGSAVERIARQVPGLTTTPHLVPQNPVSALVEAGRTAALLVVGHRGRGELASLLLGSVSLGVAARAPCPVIVVRGGSGGQADNGCQVVVGIDEDSRSKAQVAFACTEAALRHGTVEAVHAWRCGGTGWPDESGPSHSREAGHARRATTILDDAVRSAATAHPAVPLTLRPAEGGPRDILLAASATAALLVVGAERRGNAHGLQLGLVNHAVLHHAPCPVAVVPHS